ncbi:hypothetical protein BD769DRAFT_1388811 [Suillus cothurnatus]|nr:hypothetical protein BD769DRAFT_1388811 [Suillus cothurnatus]
MPNLVSKSFLQVRPWLPHGSCHDEGIGVTNLGHCHPKVSKAAADQCVNIVHAQCSISFHGPYLRLIEKLLPIMPDPSLDSFFFWNSGSEAIGKLLVGRTLFPCRSRLYECILTGEITMCFGSWSYGARHTSMQTMFRSLHATEVLHGNLSGPGQGVPCPPHLEVSEGLHILDKLAAMELYARLPRSS